MPEELWMEVRDFVQDAVIKTILKKKKCKKANWLSEEDLQIAEKRREAKGKGVKERYTHLNAEFYQGEIRKPSSLINVKKEKKTIEWEGLEICSLEEGMATHSSILAWRIPWTEEPGRLWSMGWQRAGHD